MSMVGLTFLCIALFFLVLAEMSDSYELQDVATRFLGLMVLFLLFCLFVDGVLAVLITLGGK